jgi:TPR repeat protein
MYTAGRRVPQDDAKAVEWYRKAPEQGNADAKEALKRLVPGFWQRFFGN